MRTPAGEGFTVNISIITRREEPVLITAPLLMWRKLNWKIEFLMWLKWFSDISWGGSEVEEKKRERKKTVVCFLETWRRRDYSEEKTHIGGCVLSSPRRRDEKRSLSTSAWRRAPLHAPLRLRLEMLISQTKTPLIHICNETMEGRGVSCVPASVSAGWCARTQCSWRWMVIDGWIGSIVICSTKGMGGIMRRAMFTAL